MKREWSWFLAVFFVLSLIPGGVSGADKVLKMSTTTSTENSGLLDVLLPEFTKGTGIRVKVFAKGTGAAIRDGMDGNVDIIFVHAKAREENFVAEGFGIYRLGVMHNDFVIIGPAGDPAGIRGMKDVAMALTRIANSKARFISRGDDSGTHTKEQEVWEATGLPLMTVSTEIFKKGKKQSVSFQHPPGLGQWYLSIGQGMGKALTYAEKYLMLKTFNIATDKDVPDAHQDRTDEPVTRPQASGAPPPSRPAAPEAGGVRVPKSNRSWTN